MTGAVSIGGLAAVGGGAALGAWARWGLGVALNPLFPTVPLGTLAANLIGGYLAGFAVALFHHHAGLSPELKLFLITGFLGGLTTFSTFSVEVVAPGATLRWMKPPSDRPLRSETTARRTRPAYRPVFRLFRLLAILR